MTLAPSLSPCRVGAVILAAGAGTRAAPFRKLLHPLSGMPVLLRTVSAVLAVPALAPVVVVIRPGDDALSALLKDCPVTVAGAAEAGRGLSASLRAGLCALPEPRDGGSLAGVLVVLGDMPFVRPSTLERLLDAFVASAGCDICVPVLEGTGWRGNPVLWPTSWREALMGLEGDSGGRTLLASAPWRPVPVADPGVGRDLDFPGDLATGGWPS